MVPAARRLRSPWIEATLVVLAAIVYAQVGHFQFLNWDDLEYVSNNWVVKAGLNWTTVRWAFTNTVSPNFHPLTWLSHLVDISAFGAAPGAHHLVNLGWHVATVIGVFWLLRSMTGRVGRSFIVAAIFAVHPLHVESVAWIAERKDVLSAFLAIATIGAYTRAVATNRALWKIAVVGLFALALMAKPMVVTLPALLMVLDFWPLGRVGTVPVRQLLVEKIPLAVLAVADAAITIKLQAGSGAMPGLERITLGTRVAQAIAAYGSYFWEALWPLHLSAFYPLHPVSPVAVLSAAVMLVGVSVAAFRWRTRAPYVMAGWLWFLVSLAPVSGILQAGEQAHADRYMYLALLGVLVAIVWGVDDLLTTRDVAMPMRAGAATMAILILMPVAYTQAATWSDSVSLWQHTVDVTDGNYRAAEKLGGAFSDAGRLDDARRAYLEAIRLAPPASPRFLAILHNDLGLLLERSQHTADARKEFETSIDLDPTIPDGRVNLGNSLAAEGDFAGAAREFSAAITVDPSAAEAEIGLGNITLTQGRTAEAQAHFTRAVALNPNLADAQNGLGSALIESGQPDLALSPLARAVYLRADFPSAEFNTAMALVKLGRTSEARSHLELALHERPDFESARVLLAQINR